MQGGLGMLGQVAGRMDAQDFGTVTPLPGNPEGDFMEPGSSDIELSPG